MAKVAVVVLMSTLLQFGAAIRCFDCNSANNSMCLDPTIYDAESVAKYLHAVTCSPQHTLAGSNGGNSVRPEDMFCRKMVQTILHKGHDPEVRVSRGCGWIKHHRACYKNDNEDHLETVCQCFSDDCNSAAALRYTMAVVIAVVSVALV